jgi:hypothetical protein
VFVNFAKAPLVLSKRCVGGRTQRLALVVMLAIAKHLSGVHVPAQINSPTGPLAGAC